jgi:hypothetical protein
MSKQGFKTTDSLTDRTFKWVNQLPVQKVSIKEKMKPNFYCNTYDFYIRQAYMATDHVEVKQLQDAACGVMDDDTYNYVLNPFNTNIEKLTTFPGALRNFDIISPIINAFIGEYIKSVKDFQVVAINADVVNEMKREAMASLSGILAQRFVNEVNRLGIITGIPTRQTPEPSKFMEEFHTNYNNQRANYGQDALNWILERNKSDYQNVCAFYDWITTGRVFTYKYIINGEVEREIISPDEAYPITNGEAFVEDHDAFVRIHRMSLNRIIDRFRNKMSEEDLNYVHNLANQYTHSVIPVSVPMERISSRSLTKEAGWDFVTSSTTNNVDRVLFGHDPRMIMVYEVFWKSEREIAILTYNYFGKVYEMEVDVDYELDKTHGDIALKKEWISEVMSGFRLGERVAGIYLKPEVIEVQRNLLHNVSVCKLPVNGKMGLFKNSGNHSIVKSLLPFQVLYNIFQLQRERAIAKNKGNIITLPKGILANDDEVSQEESMYYITADGLMLLDETAPNFSLAIQGVKTLNTNDAEYIKVLSELIGMVKGEAWSVIGMSDSRLGQIYASQGKAVTEQSIFRSSIISIPIFEIFNKTMEVDYDGLIDYSKFAYIDGKSGTYLNSDGRQTFFEINGIDYAETSFGIKVKNSAEETEKKKILTDVAFGAAQNGEYTVALETLDASSVSKVKTILKKYETAKREYEAAQAQADRDLKAEIDANVERRHQEEIQKDLTIAQMNNETKLAISEQAAISSLQGNLNDENNKNNEPVEVETDVEDYNTKEQMTRIKNRELYYKMMKDKKDRDLKEKQINNQLQVAKTNKNKYD